MSATAWAAVTASSSAFLTSAVVHFSVVAISEPSVDTATYSTAAIAAFNAAFGSVTTSPSSGRVLISDSSKLVSPTFIAKLVLSVTSADTSIVVPVTATTLALESAITTVTVLIPFISTLEAVFIFTLPVNVPSFSNDPPFESVTTTFPRIVPLAPFVNVPDTISFISTFLVIVALFINDAFGVSTAKSPLRVPLDNSTVAPNVKS